MFADAMFKIRAFPTLAAQVWAVAWTHIPDFPTSPLSLTFFHFNTTRNTTKLSECIQLSILNLIQQCPARKMLIVSNSTRFFSNPTRLLTLHSHKASTRPTASSPPPLLPLLLLASLPSNKLRISPLLPICERQRACRRPTTQSTRQLQPQTSSRIGRWASICSKSFAISLGVTTTAPIGTDLSSKSWSMTPKSQYLGVAFGFLSWMGSSTYNTSETGPHTSRFS